MSIIRPAANTAQPEKRWPGAVSAPVFVRDQVYSRAFAMDSGIACLTSGGMCWTIQDLFIMSS